MKHKWILMGGAVTSVVLLAACGEKAKVSSTEPGKAEASRTDSPATEAKVGPVMNGNVLSGVTAETAVAKMFDGNVKVLNEGEYVSSQVRNADKYLIYFTASW